MEVLTQSYAAANLRKVVEQVVKNHVPVLVTRGQGEAIVIVSLADWTAMEETPHLRSTAANAERLSEAIRQLDAPNPA